MRGIHDVINILGLGSLNRGVDESLGQGIWGQDGTDEHPTVVLSRRIDFEDDNPSVLVLLGASEKRSLFRSVTVTVVKDVGSSDSVVSVTTITSFTLFDVSLLCNRIYLVRSCVG